VAAATEYAARGWRYMRFMPGMFMPGMGDPNRTGDDDVTFEPMEALDAAAHWLQEVRQAVGTEVGLSIDFHHRLSVAEAALFCQKVADVRLMFVEEPIRAQSPKAYQQLRTMTPIPFAIGEESKRAS